MKNQKYRLNIKNKKIFNFLYVFLIFNILFFISSLTNPRKICAQSYSLSLTPSLTEIIIKPGKSVSQEYTITNNADPVTLTPKISPLKLNKDTGEMISPQNSNSSFTAKSWFELGSEEIKLDQPFFLNSDQTVKLILKVNIPEKAEPADYYFHFLLESAFPPSDKATASYISATVASNILLTVSRLGTLNRTGEISQFSIPLFIDSFDNPEIIINMKNTGSAFFKPLGTIMLDNPISTTKYNILPQNILVNSSRVIQTVEKLKEKADSDSTLKINKFLFGLYRISASIKIEGTNIVINRSWYFLALPYKVLFIISAVIGLYLYWKKRPHL